MEFTKEQYAALEEVAIAFGVCVEKLIRSIEELAIRFQICKVETELLEMAIENIKQQEYEYYERLQQKRCLFLRTDQRQSRSRFIKEKFIGNVFGAIRSKDN